MCELFVIILICFIHRPGPFAPIRTQDADIVFDVLDMRLNRNEAIIATTSMRLRELQDQESHDLVLHLKIRHEDGDLYPSGASIYLTMLFNYSKVRITTFMVLLLDLGFHRSSEGVFISHKKV